MTPLQFLRALRAHYKVVVILFLITVAVTLAVSSTLPVRYSASASVMVDVRASDPLTAMIMPSSLSTQIDIIESDRVSRKVIKQLKLDEGPVVKQQWLDATNGRGTLEDWLVDRMQKNIKVSPSRDSNIITITYYGGDSGFVALAANAYAQAYIDTIVEMKVEPAKQYARWFEDQTKVLRENVEQAQARLSKYQQSHGIVEKDERLDYESAKLRELSSQLTVVQGQTSDSRSKQKSGADTLPEIMQSTVITSLKSDIARREATLQETALNLGKNHPQYQRLESELASLKARLEAETLHMTRSFATASTVGQSKESELRAAIEAQKKKLLTLRNERDEIEVLQRDVAAATQALDAVNSRLNQTSLESQATRANVSLLTPAVAPLEPSSPKPLRVMLMLSMALGILIGVGAAFMLEMLDRRIRSVDDLAEMLQMPVLGVINRVKTQSRLPLSGVARPRLR